MTDLARVVVDPRPVAGRQAGQSLFHGVVHGIGVGLVNAEWQAHADFYDWLLAGEPRKVDQEHGHEHCESSPGNVEGGPDMVSRIGKGGDDPHRQRGEGHEE
jgi:hypothetical protein